jgi:hypothetical protein
MDTIEVYPGILRDCLEYYYKKCRLERGTKLMTGGRYFQCTSKDSAGRPCAYRIFCTEETVVRVSLLLNITKLRKRTIATLITRLIFQISLIPRSQHSHELNDTEYISAVYRGEMFTAAEENLDEGYDRLHTKVLQFMRCVSYLCKSACPKNRDLQR